MPHPFTDIRRILVIKLRNIGDVLLTVPAIRALRESFPASEITILVNSGTEEVLRGNPLIDELILVDRGVKRLSLPRRCARELDFARRIRRKRFDLAVDLTGGDRGALISFISGARHRIGWMPGRVAAWKKRLYTRMFRPDGSRHMVLQNLDVVKDSGLSTDDTRVDFFIPEEDRRFVKKVLEDRGVKKGATIVHVHPSSRWLFKCWRDEHMAEVIDWLLGLGATVVVTSSPERKEVEKTERILSLVRADRRGLIDLCGVTTIKELAAVTEASDLFLGVDSAPMHIAAAVGRPVVALFGPSGAFSWGPWSNEAGMGRGDFRKSGVRKYGSHAVIQRDWECIPCGKDGCDGSKISDCLEDIRPGEVKAVLSEMLRTIRK